MNDALSKLFIFGNTEYSPILASMFEVQGIIDELTCETRLHDVTVVSLADVPKDSTIINTVHNSRAYQVQSQLKEKGYSKVHFIGEIINQFPERFQNTFLKQAQDGMKQDYAELKDAVGIFADQTSKDEFLAILDFRLTLDIEHLSIFDVKIHEQYFEAFLMDKKFAYLIDGGAYDGEDSEHFIHFFPNYETIYTIEPFQENLNKAKKRLENYPGITFSQCCIGEQAELAQLTGEGTSARKVSEGGIPTEVRTIDSFPTKGKTLVKLDIEGAEVEALRGASASLKDPNYSFAISAYHLPHDIKDILTLLRTSKINRQFFFRHYSNGIYESILFAV